MGCESVEVRVAARDGTPGHRVNAGLSPARLAARRAVSDPDAVRAAADVLLPFGSGSGGVDLPSGPARVGRGPGGPVPDADRRAGGRAGRYGTITVRATPPRPAAHSACSNASLI